MEQYIYSDFVNKQQYYSTSPQTIKKKKKKVDPKTVDFCLNANYRDLK